MSTLKTVLLCVGVWFGSAWLTIAAFVLASSFEQSCRKGKLQPVAFSEFLADVEAGRVDEIRVEGRAATFRLRSNGRTSERQTVGPFGDREQVRALRPADP